MKTSFYNYSVRYGEKVIFFNGRTKGLFTVHKQVADKIFLILQNPDKYDGIFHEFCQKWQIQVLSAMTTSMNTMQ